MLLRASRSSYPARNCWAGKTYRFSTRNIDGTGKVLEIDHTLSMPVNLQYNAPNGDRRITRFSPVEFLYLKEVE